LGLCERGEFARLTPRQKEVEKDESVSGGFDGNRRERGDPRSKKKGEKEEYGGKEGDHPSSFFPPFPRLLLVCVERRRTYLVEPSHKHS